MLRPRHDNHDKHPSMPYLPGPQRCAECTVLKLTLKDDTKATLANLLADLVVDTYDIRARARRVACQVCAGPTSARVVRRGDDMSCRHGEDCPC